MCSDQIRIEIERQKLIFMLTYRYIEVLSPSDGHLCGIVLATCLLTEWEGQTGKYLAQGQDVWTERSEVRAS